MLRRRLVFGLVMTLVLFPLGGRGAAALPSDAVTMNVRHHLNASKVLVFEFAGTVSRDTRGENVEVIGRGCGIRDFRLVGGTHTRAGGRWRIEYPDQRRPWRYPAIHSGTTFRARWKSQLSAPYVYRAEAPIVVSEVPGRLARRVHVSPPPPGTVSMKGKVVLLQRLRGRRWVTIRRASLDYKPSYEHGALNHEVVFTVRRYWTLRAVLPAKSAAPCYLATFTEPFRVW